MVWKCWRDNDFFFRIKLIELAAGFSTEIVNGEVVTSKSKTSCGPRHDCQRAMWLPETHEFDTPGLEDNPNSTPNFKMS